MHQKGNFLANNRIKLTARERSTVDALLRTRAAAQLSGSVSHIVDEDNAIRRLLWGYLEKK